MRARGRRAAMRRLGARGGAARARSASLAFAAATLACLWSADAFSIGIDLGAESTTVAASRSGGSARDVSVVPDDRGGRSSPSLVGFTEKHAARVFGADAESLRATCPRCVFSDPRSLMAVPLSALRDAASGGRGYPRGYASLDRSTASAFAEDPARGTARVPFPRALAARAEAEMAGGEGEKERDVDDDGGFFFHPETLAAMLLEDAAGRAARAFDDEKTSSKKASSSFMNIETAALAVPGWWTQHQRRAFLDAASVAGFPKNKTTLVSETAAASAALAFRFQDEWNKDVFGLEKREPRSVVVALVGVGARSAWASAVRFSADHAADSEVDSKKKKRRIGDAGRLRVRVEVLQQEWEDGDGGGWALDAALAAAAVRLGKRYREFGGLGGNSADAYVPGGTSKQGPGEEQKKKDAKKKTNASDETWEIKRLAGGYESDHESDRSAARLAVASRRAKEVLSANAEVTLDALGFFPDGSDLVVPIRRDDVFSASDGVRSVAAATAPLRRLLSRRGGAVDAVELLGGGARVPAVQAAVAAIVAENALWSTSAKEKEKDADAKKNKKKTKTFTGSIPIHTRLNLEEAVAVGAATVAANATKRAESLALRAEAKALAKKKGKANAQRARAADADAAAAARAIRETPSMTDSFPHFVRLFMLRADETKTKTIVSPEDFVTVFRPGAGVPSRRAVDLDLVRSGFEVALVESARNASRVRGSHPDAEGSSEVSPRPGLRSALPPAFLEPEASDSSSSSSRRELPFARFRVDGVEANVASAFESVGLVPAKGATARVTLHFALDRGGVVALERATSATEVPAGDTRVTVVEGTLRVTETTTSTSLETFTSTKTTQPPRRSETELERERRTLRWLRARDEARAAADAALSALEGDALRTRDRLERFETRAKKAARATQTKTKTKTKTPPEALDENLNSASSETRKRLRSALTKALDAADVALVFFSATDPSSENSFEVALDRAHFEHDASTRQKNNTAFDAKRQLSATRRLRRELADAADAFFGTSAFSFVGEDEEEEEDVSSDRERDRDRDARAGRSRETDDARALVLELEDRVAELERDLEACRRGEFSARVEL